MTIGMVESAGNSLNSVAARRWDMARQAWLADTLAVAVVVSLPWSTSATAILIVCWLVALLPTLDFAAVRREVLTPAGGLPVLLWTLVAIGMLWADVSFAERLSGLGGVHRLLVIPLLLAQFRRSERGLWVLHGFLISGTVLLIVSWALLLLPGLPWRGKAPGLPVKDYILQSGVFVICIFALLDRAVAFAREGRQRLVLGLLLVSAAFLANIAYVWSGRTAIVLLVVLALLLGWRVFRWKGLLGALAIGAVLAGIMWASSPYLRSRLVPVLVNALAYQAGDKATYEGTSEGFRIEFWRLSINFIREAPLVGHGTGSIAAKFREVAARDGNPAAVDAVNPHNQIFWIAIQVGTLGAMLLVIMWTAHLRLFLGDGMIGWLGLVIVTQNIVSSLFNSHIVDFTQGWMYVFGVGVIGGMMLRARESPPAGETA